MPPVPLPSSFTQFMSDMDKKSLFTILGFSNIDMSNSFFQMPLGKICLIWLRSFSGKDEKRPDPDLWDLSPDNRQSIYFSKCINYIRIIKNADHSWYMFNFGSSRTVLWNLAVPAAAAVLFVCWLNEDILKEEVAQELAGAGIPF